MPNLRRCVIVTDATASRDSTARQVDKDLKDGNDQRAGDGATLDWPSRCQNGCFLTKSGIHLPMLAKR